MRKIVQGAVLLVAISGGAAAQTPSPPAARPTSAAQHTDKEPSRPDGGAKAGADVDVVVVTARLVEEKVQDVPAAVTGLSAQQISDAGGTRDIKDLSYLLPGLSFVDTGNINAENNIRGAGAGTARTAGVDSPIAVLVDGASITGGNIGGRTFARQDLFDISRVEVTRGPQGALYGVNAVGGVMQVISQKPKSTPGASVTTQWSNDIQRIEIDAIGNMPISDRLGARIGVQMANKDKGYFYNLATGKYGDVENYWGYKAAVNWDPLDYLNFFLVAAASEERSPSNVIREVAEQNDPSAAPADVSPPDIDGPFIYSMNAPNVSNRSITSYNLNTKLDAGFGTLTATTLYRERTTDFNSDADRTSVGYPTPPNTRIVPTCNTLRICTTDFTDHTELTSQDLRFESKLWDGLSYIVGANIQGRQTEFGTLSDGRSTSATVVAPSPTANLSSGVKEEELQTGAFASIDWRVFDPLTIDLAARYNHSEKKTDAFTVVRGPATGPTSCVLVYQDPFNAQVVRPDCLRNENVLNETFNTTAPSGSIKYEITNNLRVFASAGIGYRAGGFNANSSLDPTIPPAYQPEKNTAYEIGAKFELWNANFTVTTFENQFDDLLVTVDTPPNPTSRNYRFNAGKAKTHGVDFESFGSVKLPEGWGRLNFNAAVNYLTGKINSGPYAGRTVEGSPEWTYTGAATYRKALSGDLRFITSLSYRGQRGGYTNTTEIDNLVTMEDLDLWNGSIGIETGRYRLTLDARNLTDETYIALKDPLRSVYGDPREIRLTLAIAFGSEERSSRSGD
jgi:iron complex outermembrane receptor protein